MNKTLFLNFFSDSVKWDNLILCPAYPIGMSYFRHFRYRDEWIDKTILNKLDQGSFEYSSAIIGACFKGQATINKVLPIRKIYNLQPEKGPNYCYFNFCLGEMVDFTQLGSLDKYIIELPEYEHIENRDDPFLLLESTANLTELKFTDGSDKEELASWSKYAELLCSENNLSIADEAKKSVFIRLSNVGKIDKVNKSKLDGNKYGITLKEGKSQEINIYHLVPCLQNQHTHLPNINYDYESSTTNVQLSSRHEIFSGNYDFHTLKFTGISKSTSYSTIHVKRYREGIDVENNILLLHDLSIPIKVNFGLWHRLTNQWLFVFGFFIGLFLSSFEVIKNLFSPSTRIYEILNSLSDGVIGTLVIFGTLLTTFAFAIYQRNQ